MKRVILTALACLAVPASAAPSNSIPPWKSYKETDNPADIVSSPTVAAAIGTKVDAVNGQASGLQVQGGELTSTDLNAAVATAQGGTSAQALAAKLHEVLSIRDFGAKCDGATDDATAINAALSAASSSGTPSVLVPPSVTACMVGSTLIVPAGTAFYSALNAATIKATSSLSGPLVQFASAAQDMRIYGLILDGGGVDGSNTSPVVQGYQTTNAVVDSVTVQNAPRQAVLFSQS
ncbi:glycoside hydrolase family 55 protein, partial [Asaia bogorensis]|uniref:glycoside hydrolase family 55 protein n=1 Tax=Asaia bogorensis TaxID=91915 RepID=UPI001F11F33C